MSETFIMPKDELTLSDMKRYKQDAIKALLKRTVLKLGGDPDDPKAGEQYDVRNYENIRDAGAVLDQWRTAALAVVGTPYTVFQAVLAPATPASQLIVFYRVSIETVPLPVSILTIRTGGAAGNIIGEFDLEQIANTWTTDGFFNRPIVIDPNTNYAVQVVCRIATGLFARVQLGAFVSEPRGNVIAT